MTKRLTMAKRGDGGAGHSEFDWSTWWDIQRLKTRESQMTCHELASHGDPPFGHVSDEVER